MSQTNRGWLPAYCQPDAFLPKVPETRVLFGRRPFLFQDFLARAMAFLQGDTARKMGFVYRPEAALPCKWRCADESLFGVDLCLHAYTGQYPFDKGAIGGMFNEASLGAATHHGVINLDFGGSHVGYMPGDKGGRFGAIYRPLRDAESTDCGYLMGVIEPFHKVYEDACRNILVSQPAGQRPLISIPNEFLHPDWSSHHIKLLVDLEALTAQTVDYQAKKPHTHTKVGRSLFYLNPGFSKCLSKAQAKALTQPQPTPIGRALTHQFFNIFDTKAALDESGQPRQKLLPYMKHIVSAAHSPEGLKAAIINTSLNHNALTDAVRAQAFLTYDFVSFSGIFIDLFDQDLGCYLNLFQPLGLTIKPKGCQREVEMNSEEMHHVLGKQSPAKPVLALPGLLGLVKTQAALDKFTYQPGHFTRA